MGEKKESIFKKAKRFVGESADELKKVTWPSKDEAIHSAIVVIGFVVVFSLFLAMIDFLVGLGIESLIKLG